MSENTVPDPVGQHLSPNPGVPNLQPLLTPEQAVDLMNRRYTAKKYNPDMPVSDEDFQAIMEAGRLSPSSMGFEPWHFVLVKNEELKQKLLPYMWGGVGKVEDASHLVILFGRNAESMKPFGPYLTHIHEDVQKYPAAGLEARMERYVKFTDSDMGLETDQERNLWVDKQVYIALSNMLTVSAALGVDSTPLEGWEHKPVEKILQEYNVYDPAELHPSVMVCFGHSDAEHRAKTRRPMDEVFEVVE